MLMHLLASAPYVRASVLDVLTLSCAELQHQALAM
jgi:hypothetical protein